MRHAYGQLASKLDIYDDPTDNRLRHTKQITASSCSAAAMALANWFERLVQAHELRTNLCLLNQATCTIVNETDDTADAASENEKKQERVRARVSA
jgi:hypothetical protein